MDPGFASHSKENFTQYHCIIFFLVLVIIFILFLKNTEMYKIACMYQIGNNIK